ncbi:MAG TPA: hypothetical protein PKH24_05210 [Sedimentisphaerales bacterium]|jgi:hypothetical protein|nr:hypothetical protein [Sedimentisphaerales bacterium]HNU31501.1 hypothetical protein [Sedimentisphaerales bacterium]
MASTRNLAQAADRERDHLFFDTDYREAYPEYMKWIDAKVEEGRRMREKRKLAETPQQAIEAKPGSL